MHCVANVDAIVQQLVEEPLVDQLAPPGAHTFRDKRPRQGGCRPHLQEPLKDHPDGLGLRLIDDELSLPDSVPERHHPAHPHAALARGSDLVANAFADHFTLELREG